MKKIRWTVRIVILLVILGIAAAALAPWNLPVYTPPDESVPEYKKKEELALFKLDLCAGEKTVFLSKPVKFSMDELNILFHKHFLEPGGNKEAIFSLEHIALEEKNDRIRLLAFMKLFDTVPVVFRADGMLSDGGQIQVDSAALGNLPLLRCNSYVEAMLQRLFTENQEIRRVFERAESISLDDGDLVFKLRPPEKETPKAGSAAEPAGVAKAASVRKSITLQDTKNLIGDKRIPHGELSPEDVALKCAVALELCDWVAFSETQRSEKAEKFRNRKITPDEKKRRAENLKANSRHEVLSSEVHPGSPETVSVILREQYPQFGTVIAKLGLEKTSAGWVVVSEDIIERKM